MKHWDGGASLHLVHVMFRHLSLLLHVPSNLGNQQQGRISVIGSFFGKSVFFFIIHIAAMCWDPSYECLVALSQFLSASTASRVVLDFILVFKRAIIIYCGPTIAIDDNTFFCCFGEYKVVCCFSHCKYFSLKHSRIVA